MILLIKTVRSIWDNKKTYLACGMLIAVGIFVYVAMSIASDALEESESQYYEDYNMADGFAAITTMPTSQIDMVSSVEGVDEVLGRLVYDARVEIDGSDKIITLRLISSEKNKTNINQFYISEGTEIFSTDDIMIDEDFLIANHLEQGDIIKINIEGKQYSFNICASVLSPEYVYTMKDETTLLPDPLSFGFAYVDYQTLAFITNRQDSYNDIVFTLNKGVAYGDVETEMEDTLDRYGLTSMIPLEDNLSYAMLEQEINSIKAMTGAISMVFVMASMTILYLMLKRVIEQDRAQIGTLKAFGYSTGAVLWHYLSYGLVTGIFGGLAGAVVGLFGADAILEMYLEFFKLPELKSQRVIRFFIEGVGIATAGGLMGALMGAYGITKLNPAEAMRPKAPKLVKKDILETLPFLKAILDSRGSMAVRSIGRSKVRSVFIIVGMMFSFGIMSVMNSFNDMMDSMMLDQFNKIQVYGAKVSFQVPVDFADAVENIYALNYIDVAEGLLEMPVELKNRHLSEGIMITGLQQEAGLYKIYDSGKKVNLNLEENELILSNGMAEKLDVKRGDTLYIASPLLTEDRRVIVADVVTQNLGSGCYMLADSLSDILNIDKVATSVIFNTSDVGYVKNILLEGSNISAIEDASQTRATYDDMLASYSGIFALMRVIGIFVALAIIYNTSTISLSERTREYATLRVLGLEVREISQIMGFEYWILSFAGMALGIPFTRVLKELVSSAMDTDLFTMPTSTEPEAFIVAMVGCIAAVFISNQISKRSIAKFDIVEVLKERE